MWLKSSTLAVSRFVLHLFVNTADFCLHTKNGLGLADFRKSGFLNDGGSSKTLSQ